MGAAVGRTLAEGGFRLVSNLEGRSAESRARAEKAGIENVGSLDGVITVADALMSIMPPAFAESAAVDAAAAMARTGKQPLYMDLNAISPITMAAIAKAVTGAGAKVLEGTCFYNQYAREIGEANGWTRLLSNSAKIVNILGGYGYEPALASMEECVAAAISGKIL